MECIYRERERDREIHMNGVSTFLLYLSVSQGEAITKLGQQDLSLLLHRQRRIERKHHQRLGGAVGSSLAMSIKVALQASKNYGGFSVDYTLDNG